MCSSDLLHAGLAASGGDEALHARVGGLVNKHAAIGPTHWRLACAHASAIAAGEAGGEGGVGGGKGLAAGTPGSARGYVPWA